MFRYAFGRAEGDRGRRTIIADGLAALGRTGRIPDLMVAIAAVARVPQPHCRWI